MLKPLKLHGTVTSPEGLDRGERQVAKGTAGETSLQVPSESNIAMKNLPFVNNLQFFFRLKMVIFHRCVVGQGTLMVRTGKPPRILFPLVDRQICE